MRKHLFYIFRLSCLCLTSKLPELTAIKFPGVDCSDPQSRFFEVILPAQSYFANTADSVAACTTEASLGTFKDLEARFSGGNIAGDPWSHVHSFGKSDFHEVLVSVHKVLVKSMRPDIEFASTSSSKEGENQRKQSPDKSTKVSFMAATSSAGGKPSDGNTPGPSKS